MSSKVGKTLKIQHTQTFGKSGRASLRRVKPTYVTITAEYDGGDVFAAHEQWVVCKSKDSRADFETVETTED